MMNGKLLARMFISGANNLYNQRGLVDELNVFPVPDGDTGTNMSMTASAMSKALSEVETESVTKVCDIMSFATLRGARGNSGVILSQFFRGMAKSLKGKKECSPQDFARGLKAGSDMAYNAVMNPTEGTILTVAREAAEAACSVDGEVKEVMVSAVNKGNKSLLRTPELLPALKAAGVVDAGGQGWMFVLEGVLAYLETGEIVEKADGGEEKPTEVKSAQQSINTEDIKFMYCTEFIVEKKNSGVNVLNFKKTIEEKGDCVLVIDDDEVVKVHIHTNHPGFVLEQAIKLGAMINIKIDNMKHQHQNIIDTEAKPAEPEPAKEYGFVSICAGEGIAGIFKDLGVDVVIEGGQTMNPSTEDILDAISKINAEHIFVFPNNKNIILAAEQARDISEKHIIVVPTRAIPECVSAMLAFSPDKAWEENEKKLNKAVSGVKCGQMTFAVRDTNIDGIEIKTDDILGLVGSKIEVVGKDVKETLLELCDKLCDDDTEFVTLYYGNDVTEEDANEVAEIIEDRLDEVEVSVKYGGQPLYYYIISAE